ncbi:hypothetical protein GGR51DRAFT_558526 [Nemania sp. FL0031]|nr:hypothetical protein GGR51DRAFT_558526 [Nemania sp. FL0031]
MAKNKTREETIPAILREPVQDVYLKIKAAAAKDRNPAAGKTSQFDWLDPPSPEQHMAALQDLTALYLESLLKLTLMRRYNWNEVPVVDAHQFCSSLAIEDSIHAANDKMSHDTANTQIALLLAEEDESPEDVASDRHSR